MNCLNHMVSTLVFIGNSNKNRIDRKHRKDRSRELIHKQKKKNKSESFCNREYR